MYLVQVCVCVCGVCVCVCVCVLRDLYIVGEVEGRGSDGFFFFL